MKKSVIALALIISVVAFFSISGDAKAFTYGACTNADRTYFPWGFLCGSDNDDKGVMNLEATNVTTVGGIRTSANPAIIERQDSIHFSGGFCSSALKDDNCRRGTLTSTNQKFPRGSRNGPSRPVLTWITINSGSGDFSPFKNSDRFSPDFFGNNANSNMINASPGALSKGFCPGTDGFGPPRLENSSDSPARYTGAVGYEDCGDHGLRIDWRDTGLNGNENWRYRFNFDLNMKRRSNAKICMRLNVSVARDGEADPNNWNSSWAGHVAKQSEEYCFQFKPAATEGDINAASCSLISVRAYQSSPGYAAASRARFYVARVNSSGVGTTDVYGSRASPVTPADINYHNYPVDLRSAFNTYPGNRVTFVVWAYNDALQDWVQVDGGSDFQEPCRPPTFSLTANCQTVTLSNLLDPDNGANVNYAINVYQRNADGTRGALAASTSGNGRGNIAPWAFNAREDNVNAGWYIEVAAQDVLRNGTNEAWISPAQSTAVGPCYAATCTSFSVTAGNVPGSTDAVMANSPLTFTATFRNDSVPNPRTLPASLRDTANAVHNLAGDWSGGGFASSPGSVNVSAAVASGGTFTVTITGLTAPSTIQTLPAMSVTPVYKNLFGIGAACSGTFKVYRHFTLAPSISYSGVNWENPLSISYVPKVTVPEDPGPGTSSPAGAPSKVTTTLTKNGVAMVGGTVVTNGRYVETTLPTVTVANSGIAPGDTYCLNMNLNYGKGWLGPGDDIKLGEDVATSPPCINSHNKPYTHFTGSDVIAGGGFGASCQTPDVPELDYLGIRTYTRTTGPRSSGSGTQLAALSLDKINGFSSANLRDDSVAAGAPKGSTGLTFANDNTSGTVPTNNTEVLADLLTGENYGLGEPCFMPDYYNKEKPSGAVDFTVGVDLGASGTHAYKYSSATPLNLPGYTVVNGANNALYVDGDVNITDNIIYQNSDSGWPDVKDVPSLVIIARGDINISPTVSRLDGVFIAQPTSTNTKGRINTCVIHTFNGCKFQLVVNGAFIARQVFLHRTHSSLRFSEGGESLIFGPTAHNCGTALDTDPSHTDEKDCAAEIFNFSPEIYMSQPAMNPNDEGKYQSFTSLSPVL